MLAEPLWKIAADHAEAVRKEVSAVPPGTVETEPLARLATAVVLIAHALESLPRIVAERLQRGVPLGFDVEYRSSSAVDHPAHYGGKDSPYEAIKVIQALGFGFEVGNAFKYMARAGKKEGSTGVEDLEKAIWYLQAEVEEWKAGNRGAW